VGAWQPASWHQDPGSSGGSLGVSPSSNWAVGGRCPRMGDRGRDWVLECAANAGRGSTCPVRHGTGSPGGANTRTRAYQAAARNFARALSRTRRTIGNHARSGRKSKCCSLISSRSLRLDRLRLRGLSPSVVERRLRALPTQVSLLPEHALPQDRSQRARSPIATGWSDSCRAGLTPAGRPCLCTAHLINHLQRLPAPSPGTPRHITAHQV
jgi:hypothetical protein